MSSAAILLQLQEGVLHQLVSDKYVFLNLDTKSYFSLDEVGSRIWSHLSSGESLDGCVELILEEYEIEESAVRKDIEDLIGELRSNRIIK